MIVRRLVRDDGGALVAEVEMATGVWQRFMGLMGRRSLEPGHGLYLSPCSSIHMFFMRFALDAVFLDKEGTVLRIYAGLKPWRLTRVVRKAKACVELPAGTAATLGIQAGERLRLLP
ncbi:MAG: DUF192 domain-containing protein [Candidatus Dormibacteraeota bacterium]|nr:DUF192 domain-containing protein [Candidatus Dormibacteraeota bacterium]